MPRISAASIDAHVRQQTARIVAAAREVFRRQGYRQTDLGDIAAAVGLARNSLYRYFPNKDYILLACIEEDMAPYLEHMQSMADEIADPVQRVAAWLGAQFDIATGPAHATLAFMAEVREAGEALQQRIGELHRAPAALLEQTLCEIPACRHQAGLYAAMINAMVLSATRVALQEKPGSKRSAICIELQTAVHCLLQE